MLLVGCRNEVVFPPGAGNPRKKLKNRSGCPACFEREKGNRKGAAKKWV